MSSENVRGNTESDATFTRFRITNYIDSEVTCLSCRQSFTATSILEVLEHYKHIQHKEFYLRCCYCSGKVHRYKTKDEIKIFHNCSFTKRGLDI